MPWDLLVFTVYLSTYALAIYACVRAIGRRYAPNGAIAWVLIIIALPLVGAVLYFLFGEFRVKGYLKRHQKLGKSPNDSLPTSQNLQKGPLVAFSHAFPPTNGRVRLLVDGPDTFRAIFSAISGAQHYILVQYYILRPDRLGLELQHLLIKKAKSGIPVYLLYDDMGSFGLSKKYLQSLKDSGVKIVSFLPITSLSKIFQANFRNHRKLVVVDGSIAYTGGLNVGEEYAARKSKFAKKQRYWRDTHLEIQGDPVLALESAFFGDWHFASGVKIEKKDFSLPTPELVKSPRNAIIQVIPTGPTDTALTGILAILNLINSANHRLWISSPYFVPDGAILRALELAVMRGVDVRIILPEKSDNRFVHWVSLTYAEELQTMGVQILLYRAGFVHQKVILVDNNCTAIGTMNIDNRAMYFNFETTVLTIDEQFAKETASMLSTDLSHCYPYRARPQNFLNSLRGFRDQLIRLLSPLL